LYHLLKGQLVGLLDNLTAEKELDGVIGKDSVPPNDASFLIQCCKGLIKIVSVFGHFSFCGAKGDLVEEGGEVIHVIGENDTFLDGSYFEEYFFPLAPKVLFAEANGMVVELHSVEEAFCKFERNLNRVGVCLFCGYRDISKPTCAFQPSHPVGEGL